MSDVRSYELISIDSVVPWTRNPRKNARAVEEVMRSIKQFGFNRPIVVSAAGFPWEERTICAGHTAWEAAKRIGLKQIPAVIVNMTKSQFVKYNLADNRTHDVAQWDIDVLGEIIGEFEIDDLPGFSEVELNALLETAEKDLESVRVEEEKKEKPQAEMAVITIRATRELAVDNDFQSALSDFCKNHGFLQYTIK